MIINGKEIALTWKKEIKERVDKLKSKPNLVVILVGSNLASLSYVKGKEKDCNFVGIENTILKFPETITEKELLVEIEKLNNDSSVDGILVQLPLPKHINQNKILNKIDYNKDVDGFNPYHIGNLALNIPSVVPCTPKGIMRIFDVYDINLSGKNVCVIGRSNIVGKPMSYLLTNENATVVLCHSKTENLKYYTTNADVVIVAIGKANFLKSDFIKEGTIVVDVGINRVDDKLVGDVDFNNCVNKASLITPVPGGVGLLTRAALLDNILQLKEKKDE